MLEATDDDEEIDHHKRLAVRDDPVVGHEGIAVAGRHPNVFLRRSTMSIRFACSACGKVLRAPDDKAGVKVTCPGCKAILQIPYPAMVGNQVVPKPQAKQISAVPPQPLPVSVDQQRAWWKGLLHEIRKISTATWQQTIHLVAYPVVLRKKDEAAKKSARESLAPKDGTTWRRVGIGYSVVGSILVLGIFLLFSGGREKPRSSPGNAPTLSANAPERPSLTDTVKPDRRQEQEAKAEPVQGE